MIYIYLESFRCHTETDELGSDEPYMIVAAVDLRSSVNVQGISIPIPASRVFVYGAFGDVDEQETHQAPFQSFWGLFGEERTLPNPDDAIFLAALMEWDDGNAHALRNIVAGSVNSALLASLGVTDRATRVGLVLQAFNSAIQTPTGGPSTDEWIGLGQEVRFTREDIVLAETGNPARRSLRYRGDGGDYTLTFAARNRGQAAWRFCGPCRSLFFDGAAGKGVCPAGGGHAAAGWTFYLPHGAAGPSGGQWDRRFCDRCFAMFWAGDPANQGRCPAGGAHNRQGYSFVLPHDHNGPGQEQWRFCDRCRVMFWNGQPDKGRCVAGGGHNAQGFNFRLDYTP
ncbi:hypothetical protein [Polymorphospora sp. NPDC050346]|uniref:hypothetical protein n=1 Tax=Polymorphospora sp. NPDC050346 TaxID=3155780 RepID=UPI0033FE0F33